MTIRATCPSCDKVVKGGDDWAGRFAKCPGCGGPIKFEDSDPFAGLAEFAALEETGKRAATPPPQPLVSTAWPQATSTPASPQAYRYQMVQIPPTIVVDKDKGDQAAEYLHGVVNRYADNGWEFYRIDQIGVQVAPGCLGIIMGMRNETHSYHVITFRRPRDEA